MGSNGQITGAPSAQLAVDELVARVAGDDLHAQPPPAQDDPCRTTSPEIVRAFAFTDRLYA